MAKTSKVKPVLFGKNTSIRYLTFLALDSKAVELPSRILIADDHDLLRRLIKRKLEDHADWICIEAENGRAGRSQAMD